MKPGDFFIGLRHLFGILIPGFVWLVVLTLIGWAEISSVALSIPASLQVLIVIGLSYLLGDALKPSAFRVGIKIGKWLKDEADIQRRLGTSKKHPLVKPLFEASQSTIEKLSVGQLTYDEDDIIALSKYYVLGDAELGRRLDEIEAEINFYATMVLPLCALFLTLITYWFQEQSSLSFLLSPTRLAILIVLLYCIRTFAIRTVTRRLGEQRDIFLMFLILTDLKNKKIS